MNTILDHQIQKTDEDCSTHNVMCTFSTCKGKRYTRLRGRELKLIKFHSKSSEIQKSLASAELERRNYIDSQVLGISFDITLHAIDRLSTIYLHRFINEFDGERGISSWCNSLVKEALTQHQDLLGLNEFIIRHEGINFTFRASDYADNSLVLTTIN